MVVIRGSLTRAAHMRDPKSTGILLWPVAERAATGGWTQAILVPWGTTGLVVFSEFHPVLDEEELAVLFPQGFLKCSPVHVSLCKSSRV